MRAPKSVKIPSPDCSPRSRPSSRPPNDSSEISLPSLGPLPSGPTQYRLSDSFLLPTNGTSLTPTTISQSTTNFLCTYHQFSFPTPLAEPVPAYVLMNTLLFIALKHSCREWDDWHSGLKPLEAVSSTLQCGKQYGFLGFLEEMDSREFVFGQLMDAHALGCTSPALNRPADSPCIVITGHI